MTKKYYWFRMNEDFLSNRTIQTIRREGKGKAFEYIFVYIWLLLKSAPTNGKYYFDDLNTSLEESLAWDINTDVEAVSDSLKVLEHNMLIEKTKNYVLVNNLPNSMGKDFVK